MPAKPTYPQTQAELSRCLGVSVATFNKWTKQAGFPTPFDTASSGPRWTGPDVIRWWLLTQADAKFIESVKSAWFGETTTDDGIEEGAYKARFERAKAIRQETMLAEEQKRLVSRDDLATDLGVVIKHLRTAGDAIARKYGDDARQIIISGIEQAEESLREIAR